METINDRMEMLVNDRFDGNKAAFAKALGLPPSMMSNYFGKNRRSRPSVEIVKRIIQNLNTDPRWLLTGELSSTEEAAPAATAGNGGVAGTYGTAHHITTNAAPPPERSALAERVKLLEELLAEKERLITVLLADRQKTPRSKNVTQNVLRKNPQHA